MEDIVFEFFLRLRNTAPFSKEGKQTKVLKLSQVGGFATVASRDVQYDKRYFVKFLPRALQGAHPNAFNPVCARPSISAWTSCVPS